jgi:hypothetical protein
MFKKYVISAIFLTLFIAGLSFAQIDNIAIFTEQASWTDAATATAAADFIMKNVKVAKTIKVYSDADIGTFAKSNTKDGNFDMIITFGWFPTSLYPVGNAMVDGSVGENFLQGGDMFLNTADYIFYVSATNNNDAGLKNMTNSALDMWCDDNAVKNTPTADGKKYTPSIPATATAAVRAFKIDQIKAEKDWELEMAFSSNGANYVDPAIIHNKTNGGRVGIVFQTGDATPRAEVITEIINNYLGPKLGNTTAVKANDKLPLTWGQIKAD